jgi:CDP-diacylglycerol---glycerol-3-phosphate 3-phosphatidyltransferase
MAASPGSSASPAPNPSPTPRRDAMRAAIEPLARGMARVGLTANKLTLIGFGIAGIAAAMAGYELWLLAGIVGTFGAAFDMFDGAVARVTGTAGPFGGFMDATFDRWGEALLYVGIIIGCTNAGFDLGAWLAAAAMGSAFMVSYTRARAESFGFSSGRGMAAVGLAPREVRTVILGIGLVGAGLFGGVIPWDPLTGAVGVGETGSTTGTLLLTLSLGLIAVLASITTVQRILFTYRQAVG